MRKVIDARLDWLSESGEGIYLVPRASSVLSLDFKMQTAENIRRWVSCVLWPCFRCLRKTSPWRWA